MPRAFQLIGDLRNLRDVVRNRYRFAADAREHGEIARRRQVWAQHTPAAEFQFDSKQRVVNFRFRTPGQGREFV